MSDNLFDVAGDFLEVHSGCADLVFHEFRLPRDCPSASLTISRPCGGRVVLPMPVEIARVIVANLAARGHLVTRPAAAGMGH